MMYRVSTTISDCTYERYYFFKKPKWIPIRLFSWLIKKIFIQILDEQIMSDNLFRAITFGKISFGKLTDQVNRWQWEENLKRKNEKK